ncbi:hypothetical protein BGZ82_001525 [Podila clonocystis]|nr:hypothetical protein BGZ82_001525 [Podila clonocystis]
MQDFYRQVDSTFYAPVSSPARAYPARSFAQFFGWFRFPARLFFDLSFSPGTSVFAEWVILFFASYMIMDLVLGVIYYQDKISLLSGYFHHTFHLHDNLFGLLFVLSRFVLDALMTHELMRNTSMISVCKLLITIKVPLNIKFFADWVRQQRRLRRRQGQQKEEAIQEEKPMQRGGSEDLGDLSERRNM